MNNNFRIYKVKSSKLNFKLIPPPSKLRKTCHINVYVSKYYNKINNLNFLNNFLINFIFSKINYYFFLK